MLGDTSGGFAGPKVTWLDPFIMPTSPADELPSTARDGSSCAVHSCPLPSVAPIPESLSWPERRVHSSRVQFSCLWDGPRSVLSARSLQAACSHPGHSTPLPRHCHEQKTRPLLDSASHLSRWRKQGLGISSNHCSKWQIQGSETWRQQSLPVGRQAAVAQGAQLMA